MADCTLIIGNKNYSSWSLRAWLLLRQAEIEFEEVRVPLSQPDTHERLLQYSPAARVPVLIHGDRTIWDSLAICEYVSEQFMDGTGWPGDPTLRAQARSICAEMHAGFATLRQRWPMNCRTQTKLRPAADVRREIERIDAIWAACRVHYGAAGPWLFGEFSIADCFYAPVALRFHSYGAEVSGVSRRYVTDVLANPHVASWVEAGRAESEVIEVDEVHAPAPANDLEEEGR